MIGKDQIIVFKTEKEFINSEKCYVCAKEFKEKDQKQFCKICGNSCCKPCCNIAYSNDKIICEICNIKIKEPAKEKEKEQILDNLTKSKRTLEEKEDELKKTIAGLDSEITKLMEKIQNDRTKKIKDLYNLEEKLKKLNEDLPAKESESKNLNDAINKLGDEVKIEKSLNDLLKENAVLKATLESKEENLKQKNAEFDELDNQKKKLENSTSFLALKTEIDENQDKKLDSKKETGEENRKLIDDNGNKN